MPKRKPNKRRTAEFKQHAVEMMLLEGLSYRETAARFGVSGHGQIQRWEKTYLAESPEGFKIEKRGPGRKMPPTDAPRAGEDALIKEV